MSFMEIATPDPVSAEAALYCAILVSQTAIRVTDNALVRRGTAPPATWVETAARCAVLQSSPIPAKTPTTVNNRKVKLIPALASNECF